MNAGTMRAKLAVWAPWTDKKGRLHALRAAVFVLLLLPGISLAVRYYAGMLGARPINELIHGFGYYAVWFLITSLVITPAKAIMGSPSIAVVRRMIGNAAMFYVLIHLLLYIIDQNWMLLHVVSEIVLRFYLTIGFVALLGLVVLGVTSTDGWMKRLGKKWKRLHRIVYVIAVLAIAHYFMQTKADVSLPLLAAGIYFWLMLWRMLPAGRDRGPIALLGLTAAAPVLTLATEWLWYRFATHIDPAKVINNEVNVDFGLHPAGQVLALGLLATAAMEVRRIALGRAGSQAWFWVLLFALGAWADNVIIFIFGLDWNDGWDWPFWLYQNLAWTVLLGLLGLARWLLRGSKRRREIDVLAAGCVVYQVLLAAYDVPSINLAFAAALVVTWAVMTWQAWRVSKLAVAALLPLGLLLGYGVTVLL